MWSWMDGPIRQIVTRSGGAAEETVVTPASFTFPGKGWRHPSAIGRDHGSPYLQSWKVAFESKPKFIQIHQWNEFAGAKEGKGSRPTIGEPPQMPTRLDSVHLKSTATNTTLSSVMTSSPCRWTSVPTEAVEAGDITT